MVYKIRNLLLEAAKCKCHVSIVIQFETNPIISALEDISGERVSYPLANLRFKSHHTDELMIYERFGIRAYDYKVTYNNAYAVTDFTTAIDKKANTDYT